MTHPPSLSDLLELARIAEAAGRAILEVRDAAARTKADGSPVTEADERAQAIIVAGLERAFPGVLIVAEEGGLSTLEGQAPERFFLVDPLDGTRDYLKGSPEFTVNIALVEGGSVVAGVVHAPALGRLFAGDQGAFGAQDAFELRIAPGEGVEADAPRRPLATAPRALDGLVGLESRSHPDPVTDRLTAALGLRERRQVSSSLKFALIAAGEADLLLRAAPLAEWDVAAGHAVLQAAGGTVVDLQGRSLSYGRTEAGLRVPPFLALSSGTLAGPLLDRLPQHQGPAAA